jgi:DNA repair protein RecN (Recombination protein N)
VVPIIKEIASGGEKSRVMLVIKSISNLGSAKTIIFDEIDSGIGGSTATAVGRKIKALSNNQQILLITHNAQVAAMCTQLFKVEKLNNTGGTEVTISEMKSDHKKEEIARMISGDFITDEALAQAEHLIAAS